MITLSTVLAWIVCGIIASVGGVVIGMALANLMHKKRRSRNIAAWLVLVGTRFATRGPGKGKRKNKSSAEEYGLNDEDFLMRAKEEGGKP